MSEYIPSTFVLKSEYKCSHCGAAPPDFDLNNISMPYEMLFEGFGILREEMGCPLKINSGYRCPEYNRQIGGSYLSAHMWGLGLDVLAEDKKMWKEMERIIEEFLKDFRVGKYFNRLFFHLDNGWMIYPHASTSWKKGVRWTDE